MRLALRALLVLGLVTTFAGGASAGPIIIDGTDANDHGFVTGAGNQLGWLYMQRALENVGGQLGAGLPHTILTLGLSGGQAGAAYASAFGLSSLAPAQGGDWTTSNVDTAALIAAALLGLSTSTTGVLYIPTAGNSGGDLDPAELAAINANAVAIANFVNAGGGLFAMAESGAGAWGWLTTLLPGLIATDAGAGGIGTDITLTPAGVTAFPGLTNTDLAGADPWHGHFSGNLGSLVVLGVAPETGAPLRNVIIGGGAGTVIVPGPTVPEPSTMLLIGSGLAVLYRRTRRASKKN